MNKSLSLIIAMFFCAAAADAAFTIRNGSLVDAESAPTMSLEEHFNAGVAAYEKNDWYEVVHNFNIVSKNAPASDIGQESQFWLGIGHYYTQEYDFANESFNGYLKASSNPTYFGETVEYKYMIAEKFRNGAKRRPFGTKQLPKWASGLDMAADIYEEVIAAMPSGDMAARAMYAKGWLLWQNRDFRGSIDSFQMLIKRFPKHELTPDAYVMITHIYLDQARYEFQNPDIIAFAELSVRKFKQEFSREERIEQAEYNVMCMKELYAKGLYETGQFYERTEHPCASVIYYQNAITQFPETRVADRCRSRLEKLSPDWVNCKTGAVEGDIEQCQS